MDTFEFTCVAPGSTPAVQALAELVREALKLTDQLDLHAAGIHLNDALIELTGEGACPPGWTLDEI